MLTKDLYPIHGNLGFTVQRVERHLYLEHSAVLQNQCLSVGTQTFLIEEYVRFLRAFLLKMVCCYTITQLMSEPMNWRR